MILFNLLQFTTILVVKNLIFFNFVKNSALFCQNIWSYQKKAVPLQPISELPKSVLENLRLASHAQMAESVDALVSNTSRFTPVPVRPRLWVQRPPNNMLGGLLS